MSTPTHVASPTVAAPPARPRRLVLGLPWIDFATLVAVGLVLALTTLPRLRHFALRENEADAIRLLELVGTSVAAGEVLAAETDLAAWIAADDTLRRRLEDVELLPDGSVRRHGYLFDATRGPGGALLLRAWPWERGRTGLGAFAWDERRGLVGHPNADARWQGPAASPSPAATLRWRVR